MMPWSSEAWKKRVYIVASSDASSFNSLAGSGSGPEGLCGSMPANSLWTPFSVTVMLSTVG